MTVQQIESTYTVPANADFYDSVRAYWVPIEMRETVLAAYRAAGIPVRLRYRGPRAVSIGRTMTGVGGHTYKRCRIRAMQDCLLADATHFTVYSR